MIIIEIILTIVAWRRGWRGLALIPLSAVLIIGFMAGVIGGASGLPQAQFDGLLVSLLPLEFIGMGVLIWMAARGRRGTLTNGSAKEPESVQVVTSKI